MNIIRLADYSIYVGDFWDEFRAFVANRRFSKVIFLADDNTALACLPIVKQHFHEPFEVIKIQAGEVHKTIETCQVIWNQLFTLAADRNSLLVNLGGGVIGDMGGFCAATFKRGMPFVQMPTTLLSQVDASIGGKLGVDFANVKNSIGIFQNPQDVFISPEFLRTLPKRELRSGFAEIIKHALIADRQRWEELLSIESIDNLEISEFAKFLLPSLGIKKQIVEIDPYEKGLRKALNFGHTIGHAVESMALETENTLLHGEAVAIGMICEAFLSATHKGLVKNGGLSDKDLAAIVHFILKIYGKYDLKFDDDALLQLMGQDKKNEAAKINCSLLPSLGAVEVNCTPHPQYIKESFNFYRNL